MRYLGIDPGVTGAFAVLDVFPDGHHELTVMATPTVRVGQRRRYAIHLISEHLTLLPPVVMAYLEQQSARPGQGVTSSFSTGYGAGMWEALLAARQLPYRLIRPHAWRSAVGLPSFPTGTPKAAIKSSVALAATRRFPLHKITLDHADAVMLAVAAALEYGARAA